MKAKTMKGKEMKKRALSMLCAAAVLLSYFTFPEIRVGAEASYTYIPPTKLLTPYDSKDEAGDTREIALFDNKMTVLGTDSVMSKKGLGESC